MKTLEEAFKVTAAELKRMTPSQVDEYFAAVYDEHYLIYLETIRAWGWAHKAVGDKKLPYGGWQMDRGEVQTRLDKSADPEVVRAAKRVLAVQERSTKLNTGPMATLQQEFQRRGGWTRAYLVTDGHVHSHTECSSCHKGEYRTRFSWMIDYSGKTEEEIVEAAGDRACTICYPSAPAVKGPKLTNSLMFTPEERERVAAAEEAARKRAEKAAKAALNAITQPNGEPLRDEVGKDGLQTRSGNVVKTLTTAKIELKQNLWYALAWGDEDGRYGRNARHLARAVAWKVNTLPVGTEPTEEQIAAALAEFQAKAQKDYDKKR